MILGVEHFSIEARKIWFETVEEMQTVFETHMVAYNTERSHQGRASLRPSGGTMGMSV